MKTDISHLHWYERPSDYIGATYPGTLEVYGIHRDSDSVSRSNWRILEKEFGDVPGVFITRAHHWAVGWIDTMRVDPFDASAATIEALNDAMRSLEDYPLLDEEDHSELEWEETCDYWERCSVADRVDAIQRAGSDASIFAARRAELPEDSNGYLFDYLRTD